MKFRFIVPIAVLGVLVFAKPARAQRGMGARSGPVGRAAAGGSSRMAGRSLFSSNFRLRPYFPGRGRGWRFGPGWGWGGFVPYLGYEDYWNYLPDFTGNEEPGYPPLMGPTPYVVQEAPEPEKIIQPLVIERHGDQWVRITAYSEAPATAQTELPKTPEATGRSEATEPVHKLPPAKLVFRDGHEEEVTSYTIIDGTLYARTNYWITGAWTKKIEISSLDVPATLKLNQERGVNFRLPSGPREVMIRP